MAGRSLLKKTLCKHFWSVVSFRSLRRPQNFWFLPLRSITGTPILSRKQTDRQFKMDLDKKSKVELHIHLDGSPRPETIWDIARDRGMKMPVSSKADMKALLNIRIPDAKTLTEFLDKIFLYLPVLVGSESAIRRMTYEFCEDLARDHVIYAEARMSPHLLSDDKLPPRRVVEIVLDTLERGQQDFGVRVNLILSCLRHETSWSAEVLQLCDEFRSRGVAGMDLAGDENLTQLRPTETAHVKAFQEAENVGIRRTVHAGENGPPENVKIAVYDMKAERIGHGYHALQDPVLYKGLLEKNVHFETCPISSFITGSVPVNFQEHPIHKLAFDGANFSINSDDPTLTGCFLHGEYQFAQDELELSDKHLIISNLNAAKSAFLPESEKQQLFNRIKSDYAKEIGICQIDLSHWNNFS